MPQKKLLLFPISVLDFHFILDRATFLGHWDSSWFISENMLDNMN